MPAQVVEECCGGVAMAFAHRAGRRAGLAMPNVLFAHTDDDPRLVAVSSPVGRTGQLNFRQGLLGRVTIVFAADSFASLVE